MLISNIAFSKELEIKTKFYTATVILDGNTIAELNVVNSLDEDLCSFKNLDFTSNKLSLNCKGKILNIEKFQKIVNFRGAAANVWLTYIKISYLKLIKEVSL